MIILSDKETPSTAGEGSRTVQVMMETYFLLISHSSTFGMLKPWVLTVPD